MPGHDLGLTNPLYFSELLGGFRHIQDQQQRGSAGRSSAGRKSVGASDKLFTGPKTQMPPNLAIGRHLPTVVYSTAYRRYEPVKEAGV